MLLQQYWARLEPYQYVSVRAFASAFANTGIARGNAAALEAPQEHIPKEGELDPLQRDK